MPGSDNVQIIVNLLLKVRKFAWIFAILTMVLVVGGWFGLAASQKSMTYLANQTDKILLEEQVLLEVQDLYAALSSYQLALGAGKEDLESKALIEKELGDFEFAIAKLEPAVQKEFLDIWQRRGVSLGRGQTLDRAAIVENFSALGAVRLDYSDLVEDARNETKAVAQVSLNRGQTLQYLVMFLGGFFGLLGLLPLFMIASKNAQDAEKMIFDLGFTQKALEEEKEANEASTQELLAQKEALEENKKELEEALDHAEIQKAMHDHASRRFQSLFDGLPVGCITFDAGGMVMEWNKGMSEIFGRDAHMALLNPIFTVLGAEGREEILSGAISKVFNDQEKVTMDWEFDRAGSQRVVSLVMFPLQNPNGEVAGGIACAIDVTNEREAERQIAEMVGFQKAVLNSTDYSIISCTPDGTITGFNKAAVKLTGYREKEAIDKLNLIDLHLDSELEVRSVELEVEEGKEVSAFEALTYKAQTGVTDEREWVYQRKDEEVFPARVSLSALKSEEGEVNGYLAVAKDITVELETANRLRLLSLVAQEASNSVIICDASGQVLFVNPAYVTMNEQAEADVVKKSVFGLLIDEDTDKETGDSLLEAIRTRENWTEDVRLKKANGEAYWVRNSMTPVINNSGTCSHLVVIQEDITSRKEFELALVESEERFRDIVESAGEYIWESDADSLFTYVSDQVVDVVGYTPEELIGKHPSYFMDEEEGKIVQKMHRDRMFDDSDTFEVVTKKRHKDGSEVWQKTKGVVRRDSDGMIVGYRGTGMNITAQKRAEDALAKERERVEAVLESIQDRFYSIDREWKYVYVNQASAVADGLSAEDKIGLKIWEYNDPKLFGELKSVMERVMEKRKQASCEVYYEPEKCWFEYRIYPSAEGISVFYQDITERKKTQEKLKSQMATIKEAKLKLEINKQSLEEANEKLQSLATTDGLTGLNNHMRFQEFLEDRLVEARENETALAVSLMDVDKFKVFNDTFGHLAGDEVLKRVARTLEETVQEPHFVARYGGEEFTVVMVGLTPEETEALVEECRFALEDQDWPDRQVTASFGISYLDDSIGPRAEMIERADQALYRSKENGRNQVTVWDPSMAESDDQAA